MMEKSTLCVCVCVWWMWGVCVCIFGWTQLDFKVVLTESRLYLLPWLH